MLQALNSSQARQKAPSDDLIARLAHIIDYGTPDQKAAAHARVSLLREAYRIDREFPSSAPVQTVVETEIWNWWHKIMAQSQIQSELSGGSMPRF